MAETFNMTHWSEHLICDAATVYLEVPWRAGSRCLWPGSASGAVDPVDFLYTEGQAGREQWLESLHLPV